MLRRRVIVSIFFLTSFLALLGCFFPKGNVETLLRQEQENIKVVILNANELNLLAIKNPATFDLKRLDDFFVKDGPASKVLIGLTQKMTRENKFYGPDSVVQGVRFNKVEVAKNGVEAYAETEETWYLPLFRRPADGAVKPVPVEAQQTSTQWYSLRKMDGRWLVYENPFPVK